MNKFNQYLETVQLSKFKHDYSRCPKGVRFPKDKDDDADIYHGICKHSKKNNKMYCSKDGKECDAWKGYSHDTHEEK
mgnify:CR=1 FL=1